MNNCNAMFKTDYNLLNAECGKLQSYRKGDLWQKAVISLNSHENPMTDAYSYKEVSERSPK